uniref:Ig-like domain-containing protein n=1 Tax=Ceratitis capitata TaxID=7213 RepID=W8C637_CERCA
MDLKSMNSIIWLILFGVLAIVPGSTLNATKRTTVTATKAEVEASASPIPTIITPEAKTDALIRNSMVEKNSMTLTPQEVTMDFKTHSISPPLAGKESVEADARAKSSITSSTKDQRMKDELYAKTVQGELAKTFWTAMDTDDYVFGADFSTIAITKTTESTRQSDMPEAKVTRTAAAKAFSGGSSQSLTKVDVTTKQIKASLNRTEALAAQRVGWKVASEKDKRRIDSMVTKSTAAVTPKAIMNSNNTTTTPEETESTLVSASSEETTTDALPVAAGQPKPVTALLPLTTPSGEFTQQNYENIADGKRAHRAQIFSNNKSNYNYDYNQTQFEYQQGNNKNNSNDNNADVEDDAQHISSGYQQRRQPKLPLRRPKVDKYISDNKASKDDNNYSYTYNSNNNYYNSQQNAVSSMLVMQQHELPPRKIRQQHARQVQQEQQQHAITPPISTSTAATILSAMESNLISNDMQSKQNEDNFNKSATTTAKNKTISPQQASGIDNILFTLKPTTSWSEQIEDAVQSVGEREAINVTTTTASPFPTVSTTTLKSTTRRPTPTTTPRPTPSIDDYQTVISQAGTHAYLPCNVKQLVKKPISWLRVRDEHILTVDQTTFIADQRFQAIFAPNPERWSLQIKYVQLKDEGTYECQVSTEPKSSAIVTLRVVEPKTELIGEPTRHVKAGSQVKLRCIISQALDPPLFINWFHNQKQIYLHSRRGWRTEIERIELPITDAPTTSTTTVALTKTTASTYTTTMTNLSTTVESAATTIADTAADGAAPSPSPVTPATKPTTTTTIAAIKATLLAERQVDSSSDRESGDTESASAMPTVSSLPYGRAVGVADTYGFGTGNATSSLLADVAAAVVTMSTALPSITKAIYWPTTTITKTTMSTTLAAVEVRQITTASLIIPSVEKQDSGNYTCSPSNSAPKTVIIHVLNGEYSASAITSGVRSNIELLDKFKCGGALLLLSLWQLKFTINPNIIRILSAVTLIWI